MIHQHKLILPFVLLITFFSCSKMDDYKQYTANGEITYIGKLDSLVIRSGFNRVQIRGLFMADPKVTSCKIYWDNRADSVTVTIKRTGGVDTLSRIIEGLSEGAHSFEIVTLDAAGNRSVTVRGNSNVYGQRYQNGLINRPVASGELGDNGNVTIAWGDFDITGGARGTTITYTNTNNVPVSVYAPVQQATTQLPNYKSGTTFDYKTAYLPDSSCIDTFYAPLLKVGVKTNITAQYLKNAGAPFLAASSDGRWGIPADWTVSNDVKNAAGYGGLDAGGWLPGAALSMEAGWGLPAVPNGKIYQTFTLPAGKYSLEVLAGDCSDNPTTKYITVAQGNTLPDIDNVATAIKSMGITKNSLNKLAFELANPTQVSVGLQAKLPDTGTFLKVFSIRIFKLP